MDFSGFFPKKEIARSGGPNGGSQASSCARVSAMWSMPTRPREAGIKAFAMKPLTKREIARTIRKVLDG
jgi:hypothetical protein